MRYSKADFESLDKILKDSISEAVKEDKGIFVYGDTGVGKTYFMKVIANNKSCDVDNFVELLTEFRDYIQKGIYHEKLREFCNQDYIFIDDIGAEKLTDFVHEILYIIINKRYENMKRTTIATNLSLEKFQDRYGDRILSRIMEMCVVVELQGHDKRV